MTVSVALPFRIGTRTLARIRRRLIRVAVPLETALQGRLPPLPSLAEGMDGYLVTALPVAAQEACKAPQPRLRAFVRQRYRRSYASLEGSFEDYLGRFSARTRSTLKRKLRKLADASGGSLDVRTYKTPDEVEVFYRLARNLSALTYQERVLGAGLPDGEATLAQMRVLAAQDAVRGWLLFLAGKPISYLYAPAEGSALVYAYLGYDPDHAALSPGTVLQLEAMRLLMAERRFTLFDFTEGEGRHKAQFETGAIECVDLLLLRPSVANVATGYALQGFDGAVALAKRAVKQLRLEGLARSVAR